MPQTLAAAGRDADGAAGSAAVTVGAYRALVVEDSPEDAAIIRRLLRGTGAAPDVRVASDAAALARALADPGPPPDVLLLDLCLPDLSPHEAMGRVRDRFPDLPVVLLSGEVSGAEAAALLRAGATDYLGKEGLSGLMPVVERAVAVGRAARAVALRESALSAGSTGILIADARDPDLPIIWANAACERITGYTAAELIGRNARHLQGGDRDQPARERVRRALAEATELNIVLRNYRKDGTPFWNEMYLAPIRDAAGVVTHFVAAQHDVSERVENERLLREAGDRFRRVLEGMPDGFLGLDHDWRVRYANPAAGRLLGASPAALRGASAWEVLPAPVGADCADDYRRAQATGETLEREGECACGCRGAYPAGISLEVRAVPSPDGLTLYLRDIGARKAAEAAARRSEERFRALTEDGGDVVFLLGADDAVLYASPALAGVLGYRPEEAEGALCTDHVHPDDRDAVRAALAALRRPDVARTDSEPPEPVTYRARHRDGSWRWLETVGRDLSADPNVGGLVTHSRDVTERVRMQEQLVQAGKLAALGELLAGVAHEINNPLAAISGTAQLLRMHPDPTVRADADAIFGLTRRTDRIVRALKNVARRAPVEAAARQRPHRLADVIDEALAVMGASLRHAEVEAEVCIEDGLPPIPMEPGEIGQVLLNLLGNAEHALRAVPPGAPRRLRIAASVGPSPDVCVITVADNGPGIPPDVVPRIFDPFFTTKDTGEGTGLGLYISYGLVAAHGGTLTAAAPPGGGALFTLTLPLAAPEQTFK